MSKGTIPVIFAGYLAATTACEAVKPDKEAAFERIFADADIVTEKEALPADAGAPKAASACPRDMVEIEGKWCSNVEQICLRWVTADGRHTDSPEPGTTGRCAEFKRPARCLVPEDKRPVKHFCIDRYEFGKGLGERPTSWMSWYDAKVALEKSGKRLCTDSEWTMACEGPGLQPYPYGDGYVRDKTACNFDNSQEGIDVFKATSSRTPTALKLDSLLTPSGTMPRCRSPYGVFDMVGNVDEFVVNETGKPYVSGLKGGHVFGVRNACRPMTEKHGPEFSWYETGTRGCRSLP